jgi:hypothetical protein
MEVIQVRGNLMGNSESWSILNLYNKFFSRLGESVYRLLPADDPRSVGFSWDHPVVQRALTKLEFKTQVISKRCGDDQVSMGPLGALKNYVFFITLSGAIPSPGTNAFSDRYFTFTQYLAKYDKTLNKGEYIDVVRIISLVDEKGINRSPALKETPRIWFRGSSYVLTMRYWNKNPWEVSVRKGVYILFHYLCAEWLRRVSRLGLEPFLPSFLGGLGCPHPRGNEFHHVTPRIRAVVMYLLRDSQSPDTFFDRMSLNVWQVPRISEQAIFLDNLEKQVFYDLFSEKNKLDDLSKLDSLGDVFCWFDLNQIRQFFSLNLPLNQISFKIVQGLLGQIGRFYPIVAFWKIISGSIRSSMAFRCPPGNISSADLSLGRRAVLFRQKVRSILPKVRGFEFKERPLGPQELFQRHVWANSFVWCSGDPNQFMFGVASEHSQSKLVPHPPWQGRRRD